MPQYTAWETPYVQTSDNGTVAFCVFRNFTSKDAAIRIKSATFSLDLQNSVFDEIECSDPAVVSFGPGANCTIRCAGSDNAAVGVEAHTSRVPHGSANLTLEFECGLGKVPYGSFFGGRSSFAFFCNNFTANRVTTHRSCFSLETSPFQEGATGFNQATGCQGGPMLSLYLDRNSLFEDTNLINSTISRNSGCFQIVYSHTATLRRLIIEVKEKRGWIEEDSRGTPKLVLVVCQVPGHKPPSRTDVADSGVSVVETTKLSPIHIQAGISCRQPSALFTRHSPEPWHRLAPLFSVLFSEFTS